ncbi:MATE efflux family protein [Perilla frutescens var. hirtella]|uniref:Protein DETOXIFICATION n=1 Tax=Perilla frutescens var. hirtella TaxID=608512 RepID=A0AAD4IRR9_PERFH|nr:MATE efflux family protein [Perilla frutescens var. hirtella]KAH6820304.1 MATE efflux family protein [Perilla frutescens var. hirtella]
MNLRVPIHHSYHLNPRTLNRRLNRVSIVSTPILRISKIKNNPIFISNCISPSNEVAESIARISPIEEEKDESVPVVETTRLSEEISENDRDELSENDSLWIQMVEIAKFSGPAVGLWICGPLMSLIDTAVIGQCSSVELAALGPGTVFCDNTSYVFMFLSIATSNLVATSLARQDKNEVQHQISNLLFVGLACGFLMVFFTRCFGPWALTVFTGANNPDIIAAANTYVQIRGLAWPAVLIGWVAQSASLGMKDSWGPLKALAAASAINGVGDIVLCRFLGCGIAGAAWATMVSQVVAAYMMVRALNSKGYNGFAVSLPSPDEFLEIFMLAAPVFVTMMSKVMFYSLIVYFATSMGTKALAAHQVMIQVYCVFTVFGEPLSQTAQSFMPEMIYGANRNLAKARTLLKSLLLIGLLSGLILGSIGISIPWLFPRIFSPDPEVIQEMHKVLIPYFMALCITPATHSLEGTLMAGRDLKFISMSMSGIFALGSLILLSRFSIAFRRLTLPTGVLYSDDLTRYQIGKLKSV